MVLSFDVSGNNEFDEVIPGLFCYIAVLWAWRKVCSNKRCSSAWGADVHTDPSAVLVYYRFPDHFVEPFVVQKEDDAASLMFFSGASRDCGVGEVRVVCSEEFTVSVMVVHIFVKPFEVVCIAVFPCLGNSYCVRFILLNDGLYGDDFLCIFYSALYI